MFVEEKALPEAPVKKLEPWQEYCLKAADYIDEHGWCQRMRETKDKRVCLLGALMAVTTGNAYTDFYIGWAGTEAYDQLCHLKSEGVVGWNDARGRTKGEVTAFLRSVAQLP